MPRTEVRKECPSCGLRVPIDAKICEFCKWNFDEEDEWMSQIEKLEQDLVADKQKFDDSSVDKMIQSTLRNPNQEPRQSIKRPPIMTVKKKRIMETPPQPAPAREQVPARPKAIAQPVEKPIVPPRQQEPRPAQPATKPTFRIDVSKISAPKEKDLELEFDEPKEKKHAPAPAGKSVAEKSEGVKPDAPAARPVNPAPAAKPVASAPVTRPAAPSPAPAQSKQPEKTVRRVVTPAAQPKPAAEKPKAPAAPPKKPAEPEKEEKKSRFGGFGKMFSISQPHQKDGKHAGRSAPEKIRVDNPKTPPKQTIKVFVCPLCNAEVKETEKTCPNCGAEFE